MPKIGMEPLRRAALIDATITEIGLAGSLDITVSQIARRAGVSSGLAHHYFGGKDQILLAAMRRIMADYAAEVRAGLKRSRTPRDRLEAIVSAGFSAPNFKPDTVSAWLNFYVHALSSAEAGRLHRAYTKRHRSNLRHALRPIAGSQADELANLAAALIDGLYLQYGLAKSLPAGAEATAIVMSAIEKNISHN
ncbi:MAG: transcriptional regulator BetI [Boseongicola sp.]|nr:MAG: transcriptional regulator BetI [Boseongicola sp.]